MVAGERGDLLMAQGRFEEAKRIYAELSALHDGPPTAREIRAALACGEQDRARKLLQERQAARDGTTPSIAELRLELTVAEALEDEQTAGEAATALEQLEWTQREHLIGMLALNNQPDLEVVPDVPALEPADGGCPRRSDRHAPAALGLR